MTFHNLRGYDSHLIFCELYKFDVKIDVIPNGPEKYMTFIDIVFIDSVQFMKPHLDKLVKNLGNNDFKYFTEEFDSKNLELLTLSGPQGFTWSKSCHFSKYYYLWGAKQLVVVPISIRLLVSKKFLGTPMSLSSLKVNCTDF